MVHFKDVYTNISLCSSRERAIESTGERTSTPQHPRQSSWSVHIQCYICHLLSYIYLTHLE